MVQLVEGWDTRTQQKIALAGCLAAGLSLRSNPLATGSRLREFTHKLIGYSAAAVLFSGVQESARAVRGRHDFLNSAVSGAATGALVVGYYQGPQYRLLGLLTWGSLSAALHVANAVLRPRHLLEDYLIREGLLSPEVARRREEALEAGAGRGVDQSDVMYASLAIRERELRALNERLAAGKAAEGSGSGRSAPPQPGAPAGGPDAGDDVPDDDPGYVAWLRSSGMDADVLLQGETSPSPQQQRTEARQHGTTGRAGDGGSSAAAATGGGPSDGASTGPDAAAAAPARTRRTWMEWLRSWRPGSKKAVQEPGSGGNRAE